MLLENHFRLNFRLRRDLGDIGFNDLILQRRKMKTRGLIKPVRKYRPQK
jgi:hypothetical protein